MSVQAGKMRNSSSKKASEESDYSYRSSRNNSRSESEYSYGSEPESKSGNATNKQVKRNPKPPAQKKSQPLIRGQRDYVSKRKGGGDEAVTNKVLAENKIKMSELRNRNIELADLIAKYEAESRDLMRIIRKQEKQLKQFQEQENSMPVLIQRQSAESHALHEQMRSQKEKLKHQEKKLKDAEEELEQKQRLLKKMKSLVDDHQLKERDELRQRVDEAENGLKNKSDIIRNLERHIENLNKNHKHELGIKKAKQHSTANELETIRGELERMQTNLQEKEKELAVLNIYAQQRFQTKPPHRLTSSIRSTPLFDKQVVPQNSTNKIHNNSVNEPKSTERSLSSEKLIQKPKQNNVSKSNNKSNEKKNSTSTLNNITEEKRKRDDQDDIDKKIAEMENKAKIKTMKHDGGKVGQEIISDRKDHPQDKNNHDHKNKQKQKELLLAKMKDIDETNSSNKPSKRQSSRQPMFDDNLDDFSFGTYQPSFAAGPSSTTVSHKSKKKSELFSELFMDDSENFKYRDTGRTKSPVLLSLDGDPGKRSHLQSSNKSHLLPLRSKQQVSSLATLNGIDSDEDMKELR